MEQSTTLKARALSSPVRVKILKLLKQRRYTLSEVARELKISKTNAKTHLDKLAAAGLVNVNKRSKWKYYALKEEFVGSGGVSITLAVFSFLLSIVALFQAFSNTYPAVPSPDHEYTYFTSFTPAGYVLLFIAFLASVAFLTSIAWLIYSMIHKR